MTALALTAYGQGIFNFELDQPDVDRTIQLARHTTFPDLGALMLHAPNENIGKPTTTYFRFSKGRNEDNMYSKQAVEAAAQEQELQTLPLQGVELTEQNLALELYRAARKTNADSSSKPDVWLGTVGGAGIGLAGYVIAVGTEVMPVDVYKTGLCILGGAVVGLAAKPILQSARYHYDRRLLQDLRPVRLGPQPTGE